VYLTSETMGKIKAYYGNSANDYYSNGVFYPCSTTTMGEISDGTANTYLCGEKYLCPDNYSTGTDDGDNVCALAGDDNDIVRWTEYAPARDTPSYVLHFAFGSPHVGGFNMAFCDGSVHTISFGISTTIHNYMAQRNDGKSVDPASLNNM
jgi:prepilin-type processing-associated H-X9-DG protein